MQLKHALSTRSFLIKHVINQKIMITFIVVLVWGFFLFLGIITGKNKDF